MPVTLLSKLELKKIKHKCSLVMIVCDTTHIFIMGIPPDQNILKMEDHSPFLKSCILKVCGIETYII